MSDGALDPELRDELADNAQFYLGLMNEVRSLRSLKDAFDEEIDGLRARLLAIGRELASVDPWIDGPDEIARVHRAVQAEILAVDASAREGEGRDQSDATRRQTGTCVTCLGKGEVGGFGFSGYVKVEQRKCPTCSGSGEADYSHPCPDGPFQCGTCGGSGWMERGVYPGEGDMGVLSDSCPDCGGTGRKNGP